jgi:SAM domain (Sterile alpha motif)
MPAPVASGWSVGRVGLAPTGKRRLFTAHADCGRWSAPQLTTAMRTKRPSADGLTNVTNRGHCCRSRSLRYGGSAPGAAIRSLFGRAPTRTSSLYKAPSAGDHPCPLSGGGRGRRGLAQEPRSQPTRGGVPWNAIDGDVLPSITSEDLKDLGVTIVGYRRELLDAIAALRAAEPEPAPSPEPAPASPPPPAPASPRKTSDIAAERRAVTVLFCDLVGSTALCGEPRCRGLARPGRLLSRRRLASRDGIRPAGASLGFATAHLPAMRIGSHALYRAGPLTQQADIRSYCGA